jgi:hypothetical protein
VAFIFLFTWPKREVTSPSEGWVNDDADVRSKKQSKCYPKAWRTY